MTGVQTCALPICTELAAVTAGFGMDIVFSHAGDAIATHAVLDSLARHYAGFDAAILAISFDSGLAAARELLPIPVLGITGSALNAACALGQRIGIITFGAVSRRLYDEVFARSGVMPRVAGIRTIDIASAGEYLAPAQQDARIVAAANALATEDGADAVVICGAAMAGVSRRVSAPQAGARLAPVLRLHARHRRRHRQSEPVQQCQSALIPPPLPRHRSRRHRRRLQWRGHWWQPRCAHPAAPARDTPRPRQCRWCECRLRAAARHSA